MLRKKNEDLFLNVLFYICFTFLFINEFCKLTVYSMIIPDKLMMIMKVTTYILILIKTFFFDRYSPREILIYSLTGVVVLIAVYFSNITILIDTFFFMILLKNLKMEKVIKFNFILLLVALVFTIFLSLLNIIPNYEYYRYLTNGKRVTRNSFGTIYPTVLGSMIYFLYLQYVLFLGKNRILLGLIGILLSIFVTYYTDNRLIFILLFAIGALILIKIIDSSIIKKYIKMFMILLSFLPIIVVYYSYNYIHFPFLRTINNIVSNRLMISWQGFQMYPIKLFGQPIIMNGYGANRILSYGEKYFYLDILPVYLILGSGIVVFCLYVLSLFILVNWSIKINNAMLFICLLSIILYDLIDDKSLYFILNPAYSLLYIHIIGSKQDKNFFLNHINRIA